MSEFSSAVESLFRGNITVDMGKAVEIVNAIVAAAPAIEQGIMSVEPYVSAIVDFVKSGGQPKDSDWAALRDRLDAGTKALSDAAAADPGATGAAG